MKKVFLLTVLMVMMFVSPAFAASKPVEVFINRVELETDQPAVLNKELKRTYLPLRAVSEDLGAQVEWEPKDRKVHIKKDGRLIIVPIGLETAWVNDKQVEIGAPAYVEKATNRAMVPLRFVSEALGTEVRWDNKYKVVYIIDPDKPMGMCARDYLEKGNPLHIFAKLDIECYEAGRISWIPIVMQGYPPYAAPDGTVWVKDVEFDGKYLTYTERICDWRNRHASDIVSIEFFDEYGNMTTRYGASKPPKIKEDGVWRTWGNIAPGDGIPGCDIHELKGEVVEIHFYEVHDGQGIVWIYEVRD